MGTVGRYKVDVMRERILDINPQAVVRAHRLFYGPETADGVGLSGYDYIIDAVDTVTAKLELVLRAQVCGVPVISSMGAANKLDPTAFVVADIYKTSGCPLARVMRRELKKHGVESLKVVYSREEVAVRRQIPASNAFVPPTAGLIIAGEVVKDIIKGVG
jgi:tRNA A37 threonylcarbamoyladenosine dehydratase